MTTQPHTDVRTDLGRRGETLAARHLTSLGMRVLARNWRCPGGELDLVLRQGSTLIACEVKTRSGTGFGDPSMPSPPPSRHGFDGCWPPGPPSTVVGRMSHGSIRWASCGRSMSGPLLRHVVGDLS